jgi:ubiquinone/menaquinone biosynthesis C-methylase UbiE
MIPSISNKQIKLLQCNKCGFIFTSPQIKPIALSEIYNKEASYFKSYSNTTSTAHHNRQKTFVLEIKKIKHLAPGKKILDVGCNGGFFLNQLDDKWDKTGVEIDPEAANSAKKLLGRKAMIINSELNQAGLADNSFDCIVIRGTIEHVPNPSKTLKTIFKLLKPNGIVAINTQNIDSFAAKLYRLNFRLLDPIHHIWNFSPKTISRLCEITGLKVEDIDFNYFNTPYFNIKDILYIFIDWIKSSVFGIKPSRVSPSFYGNIMDVYARKPA